VKAIIGGTSLLSSSVFKEWEECLVATPYGEVCLKTAADFVFLQRHGMDRVPPHRINHRAHIRALKERGVEEVVAINSVGSLKTTIKPGMFVIPDDFISPWEIPTFFDDEMRFTVPRMDEDLAATLYKACRGLGLEVVKGGTYVQTRGPRFETRAEIRMFRRFGDVVGMTMASEATLCCEYAMPYASLCCIDNYCHGIIKRPLTMDEINEHVAKNAAKIERAIGALLAGGLP